MNKQCAVTIGFFDGVHRGHRCLLRQLEGLAAERGLLPVAVTFDRHPMEVIRPECSPALLTTAEEKSRLLHSAFSGKTAILSFTPALGALSAQSFMQNVLRRQFDTAVLLMGYDHNFGHGGGTPAQYVEWGKEAGIEVVQAHVLNGEKVSSSRIRRLIAEGCIEEANRLLGYSYFIGGTVIRGKQIGRTIGFPTANLHTAEHKLLPGCGVYAVRATLPDGICKGGMLCIGHRPTVETAGNISIEANIFDFNGDLYGSYLRLDIVERLREERAFNSLCSLKQQLSKDAAAAKRMI